MLLYDDVYCQSNCLSVPGCQVLRGVIHNNNRAKPGSGHWTGDLKEPVRDLGKFPTHHRSPSQPIQVAPISIPDLWPDYTPADGLQAVLCRQFDIQEMKWLHRRCLTGVHFCVQSPSYCKTSVKHSTVYILIELTLRHWKSEGVGGGGLVNDHGDLGPSMLLSAS